jgi:hypothetical protein
MPPLITREELHQILVREIAKAGSQSNFAQQTGFSISFISDVVRRKRQISPSLADTLGYCPITMYQRIDD